MLAQWATKTLMEQIKEETEKELLAEMKLTQDDGEGGIAAGADIESGRSFYQ